MSPHAPPAGGVLCAGFGTRMQPITDAIPKPLIPFLNTPILAYSLNHLSAAGATRVGMNLHHLPDSIPPVADRLAATMNLDPVYVREWEILGTAGGVRGIWDGLDQPETTLIVLNGDSVLNIDLMEALAAHRASEARATLVVRERSADQPGGVWVDESDGKVLGLGTMRHPDAGDDGAEYDFCGVHFIEPELLREIPLEKGCMVNDVYGPLMEDGEGFNTYEIDGFWVALDNPSLLFDATRRVLDEPSIFDQVPMPEPLADDLYVFNPSGFDDKTMVAGPVLTGAHVEAGHGAHIGPYAVVDGAEIVDGASVRNAIVYGTGRLEGKWHRCVVIAGEVANLPRVEEWQQGEQGDPEAVGELSSEDSDDADESDEVGEADGDEETPEPEREDETW